MVVGEQRLHGDQDEPATPAADEQRADVSAGTRPSVSRANPSAISSAAPQSTARRPEARLEPRGGDPGEEAAGGEGRDVQPAERVADVELVAQVRDDQARRRLQVGEPGEQRVGQPRQAVAPELHPETSRWRA